MAVAFVAGAEGDQAPAAAEVHPGLGMGTGGLQVGTQDFVYAIKVFTLDVQQVPRCMQEEDWSAPGAEPAAGQSGGGAAEATDVKGSRGHGLP